MYDLHDVVEMKKAHPCGANRWEIIRVGADIKLECQGCGHIVMMPRRQFEKRMKKVLSKHTEE
ncbi:DUF951 domain-containing protein [Fructilactobacillus ixorae]|uniref:DUF951 domain-containing protein n=2 Tax=Fructilactobacillus TaxID=2767881 RepID=A0ABY5BMC9_9LACO|nr:MULTISPECIES: DUF951 domain-containing protein [Fructilactobacillus]USS84839.1 DUF951 domain-containing protein [Fructilactobacillus myrtifloralis]USS93504.1 DUF951 domain-containing protein [Fructilactobacillus ixorae]